MATIRTRPYQLTYGLDVVVLGPRLPVAGTCHIGNYQELLVCHIHSDHNARHHKLLLGSSALA